MEMDPHFKVAKVHLLPIFTARVLRELLVFGSSPRVDDARRALVSISLVDPDCPIRDVFKQAYSVLRRAYPAEYVLINECLCAQVSGVDSVVAYREQAVAGSKADLSIFSPAGHSRGYEIKSRFDRLDRLQAQLRTYQQVFSHSYVVTDHNHVPRVMEDSPASVGVLSVSRDGIQELRPARERLDLIRLDRLFSLLRKEEYLHLIGAKFGAIPKVPNTQIYGVCLQQFQRLDAASAQELVVETLCRRQSRPSREEDQAWRLPRPLRALALTGKLDQSELLRLSYVLEQ
ncbi:MULTISPECIES: sce7726 family protein [unclassified Wenzhouxiangella]|uniref:sce7726 family protein n=1 Tax=unclassified Wenzhouxiangella TaxID=2613841 RepID=UPI000E328189|nr:MULTISPECIES: sce7726 family protein [unclassified Wenzhouxiangella]RFF27211.1 hypothetical protein DZK25_09545 [Wenzhouxiangella sp. 15181]RFP69103.1 hypothetical protein DZK26_04850 [Wenzhouxiangella sp. 15190]